jgi:hypothetical protein
VFGVRCSVFGVPLLLVLLLVLVLVLEQWRLGIS